MNIMPIINTIYTAVATIFYIFFEKIVFTAFGFTFSFGSLLISGSIISIIIQIVLIVPHSKGFFLEEVEEKDNKKGGK